MARQVKTAKHSTPGVRPVERLRQVQLKVQTQFQYLKEQNLELQSQIETANAAKKAHAAQEAALRKENERLQAQGEQILQEKAKLQEELVSLTRQSEAQITDMAAHLEQVQQQNKALQCENAELQDSSRSQLYYLTRKIEFLEQQNQSLKRIFFRKLLHPFLRIAHALHRRINPQVDAGRQAQDIEQCEVDLARAWGEDSRFVCFDFDYYRSRYDDVPNDRHTALLHYILHGERKGEQPNGIFDPAFYLQRYGDVKESGLAALQHFLLYGMKEGRSPNASLHPLPPDLECSTEALAGFLIEKAKKLAG